jgi:hypothetical protein
VKHANITDTLMADSFRPTRTIGKEYGAAMTGLVALAIALGLLVAFRAGARWRHNTLTWSDHKAALGKERGLRKARWKTLKLAIFGMLALVVYLFITGAVGAVITTGNDKPTRPSPSPSVCASAHATCAPTPAPAGR